MWYILAVFLDLIHWVKMTSDSKMRACHLLSQFPSGLSRVSSLISLQLVLIKLNRRCGTPESLSVQVSPIKPFLCHSIDNEVISVYSTRVSSSLGGFVALIERKAMLSTFILVGLAFHVKGVSNRSKITLTLGKSFTGWPELLGIKKCYERLFFEIIGSTSKKTNDHM